MAARLLMCGPLRSLMACWDKIQAWLPAPATAPAAPGIWYVTVLPSRQCQTVDVHIGCLPFVQLPPLSIPQTSELLSTAANVERRDTGCQEEPFQTSADGRSVRVVPMIHTLSAAVTCTPPLGSKPRPPGTFTGCHRDPFQCTT